MNEAQRRMDMQSSRTGIWALLGALAIGCGGAQLNQGRATDVQAAMRAAEAVGAEQQPKASLELQLAKEQFAQAKRLAADGEEADANLLLERAKVDADLALQLARTEQEQQKARESWEKVKPGQPGQAPVPATNEQGR
jgi:uncharacterized protein HemX